MTMNMTLMLSVMYQTDPSHDNAWVVDEMQKYIHRHQVVVYNSRVTKSGHLAPR